MHKDGFLMIWFMKMRDRNEWICMKTCLQSFRPGTLTIQPQRMARGLKFWFLKEEGLFFLCRENKGADQPCG